MFQRLQNISKINFHQHVTWVIFYSRHDSIESFRAIMTQVTFAKKRRRSEKPSTDQEIALRRSLVKHISESSEDI